MSDTATAYTIPIAGGNAIIVEGDFPVAEQDWQQFLAVLNAMKPGLVRNESDKEASE